jgi:hypothetical protein
MDDFIIGEIDEKTLTVITVRKPYHILKMLSKSFGHECRQSYQLVFLCWSLEGVVDFSAIPQAERRAPMKQSLKFPVYRLPGPLAWGCGLIIRIRPKAKPIERWRRKATVLNVSF